MSETTPNSPPEPGIPFDGLEARDAVVAMSQLDSEPDSLTSMPPIAISKADIIDRDREDQGLPPIFKFLTKYNLSDHRTASRPHEPASEREEPGRTILANPSALVEEKKKAPDRESEQELRSC